MLGKINTAWQWLTFIPRSLVAWLRIATCALTSEQGRRGWAMLAALGCCVVMSAEVGVAMWIDRRNPILAFWFGMSAQLVNLIVVTGLMVLLGVRRNSKVSIPLPTGGTASLELDDAGKPVVTQTSPTPPPAAPSPVIQTPPPPPPQAG